MQVMGYPSDENRHDHARFVQGLRSLASDTPSDLCCIFCGKAKQGGERGWFRTKDGSPFPRASRLICPHCQGTIVPLTDEEAGIGVHQAFENMNMGRIGRGRP